MPHVLPSLAAEKNNNDNPAATAPGALESCAQLEVHTHCRLGHGVCAVLLLLQGSRPPEQLAPALVTRGAGLPACEGNLQLPVTQTHRSPLSSDSQWCVALASVRAAGRHTPSRQEGTADTSAFGPAARYEASGRVSQQNHSPLSQTLRQHMAHN